MKNNHGNKYHTIKKYEYIFGIIKFENSSNLIRMRIFYFFIDYTIRNIFIF